MLTPKGLAHPVTRAAVNKRLAAIAAGRASHKPTAAHPFPECFDPNFRLHYHYGLHITRTTGSKYEDIYGPRLSCAQYIAWRVSGGQGLRESC